MLGLSCPAGAASRLGFQAAAARCRADLCAAILLCRRRIARSITPEEVQTLLTAHTQALPLADLAHIGLRGTGHVLGQGCFGVVLTGEHGAGCPAL